MAIHGSTMQGSTRVWRLLQRTANGSPMRLQRFPVCGKKAEQGL